MRLSGSIIIPAHNEASVIGRTLGALGPLSGEGIEIVVVANGCTDDTAEVARAALPSALVIETEVPSKPAALRLGEAEATKMPRLYLDADIHLTSCAAAATLLAMANGAAAARPPLTYETTGATWLVRCYFAARGSMPSMNKHAWGAGIYGMSTDIRSRFDTFPDLVGDDLWVDQLLQPGELVIVDTDPVIVTTPKNTRSLLPVLRRAQRGKAETAGVQATGTSTQRAALTDLAKSVRSVGTLIDALVYMGMATAARLTARRGAERWERDDSSRLPTANFTPAPELPGAPGASGRPRAGP